MALKDMPEERAVLEEIVECLSQKLKKGKTLREALRVLKTYIARELYRRLRAMQRPQAATPTAA